MAATRVAIDSLREFWPIDADLTSACEDDAISMALRELEEAYVRLSMLNQSMLGVALAGVLSGMITDSEHLEAVLGEE